MQITINIKDEQQLKSEIKDLVEAFIKQTSREEAEKMLKNYLVDSLSSKVKEINQKTIDGKVDEALKTIIQNQLSSSWYQDKEVSKTAAILIERTVDRELSRINFEKTVEHAISDKVEKVKKEILDKLK
jgi:predicted ArsR family transcriptional regulator